MNISTAATPAFLRNRLRDRVILITGAARGQGRAHAIRLAQEGADIIAVGTGRSDLEETARQVKALGRQAIAFTAGIRDHDALVAAAGKGAECMGGRLDGAVADAGIASYLPARDITPGAWAEMIDVTLTGAWYTAQAVLPHLIRHGPGASLVLTTSTAVLRGNVNQAHYTTAEHGVVGVVRTLAKELAPHMIRVNAVAPTAVNTQDLSPEDVREADRASHLLPVPWVEPEDVSNAALFLLSDEARYVTGALLPVDAGRTAK